MGQENLKTSKRYSIKCHLNHKNEIVVDICFKPFLSFQIIPETKRNNQGVKNGSNNSTQN